VEFNKDFTREPSYPFFLELESHWGRWHGAISLVWRCIDSTAYKALTGIICFVHDRSGSVHGRGTCVLQAGLVLG